jgi:hypothetical protein
MRMRRTKKKRTKPKQVPKNSRQRNLTRGSLSGRVCDIFSSLQWTACKLTSFLSTTVETGEEQEKTYFSCKAKLFQFTNQEWKERGIGTFKVNVRVTDGREDKKAARMIMRADGVLRVMLNQPLFKGMKVGDPSGNEPKSKQVNLVGYEDGRTVPLLLRVRHSSTIVHRIMKLT